MDQTPIKRKILNIFEAVVSHDITNMQNPDLQNRFSVIYREISEVSNSLFHLAMLKPGSHLTFFGVKQHSP